ncbi:hypothetical protein [Aquabacter spiritensis]|uniref:ElaB/YqjD/DUF883 family membrane-anchored ribosome-binding protein n=1 Tax=Aquabacter spiritensis TaxID=933073 RepID=A0A4R3LV63_9HYPH|nr:hypothetical protein [Aquabacter spiritensis]TCT03926.1 hypothetical protein EDC64_10892 [Aquabacter spiritensis]
MADTPNLNLGATPGSASADEPHIAELKADLAAVKADLAQLMDTLSRTARHGVNGATGEAEAAIGEVSDWAESQYESLRENIRAQPLTACAIAAGIGALLGQILLRR